MMKPQFSEYLIIRLVELLPEEDLKNINSIEELFDLAKQKIPNLEERVKIILQEFKNHE